MLIDMHVHTEFSEGFETKLADVATACRGRGIEAALLAECDVVPQQSEIEAATKEHDFIFFVGVDIDASDGRVIAIPEDPTDERFVKMEWRTDDGETSVAEVLDLMNDIGGVVVACHPYLDDGGPFLGDRVYKIRGLAGIEVECGVRKRLPNDLALEAASGMKLPTIAGSDTGPEGQRLGSFATAFASEVKTQAELVNALRAGTCWAVKIEPAKEGEPRNQRSRGRGGRGR
ncbi:MAG: PHP-associated domain-containing protein [Myxococcota bacterium]|nr:PHP-associated domain-containing protein [Myxococcota bacterium]